MAQEHRSVTIQLPPDLLEKLEELSSLSKRSVDEVVHEAVAQYIDDDWQELLRYGVEHSTREGLTPDDVERLIEEYRQETR